MSARRLTLLNTSGETAPPFGIAEVANALPVPEGGDTTEGASVLEIRKPTGTGRVVAIAPCSIEDDRYGKGFTGDCHVRFTGSDPSPGDTLHATAGSWALSADGGGTGVVVAGDIRTIGTGETAFKIVRVEIGGGSGSGGGSLTRCVVYDDLPAGSFDSAGKFAVGADVRCLPVIDDAGEAPDLDAEFILAKWRSASSLALSEAGCCSGGDSESAPTGPRITTPVGPGSINRVKAGETLDLEITGVVPGESLTASIIAINPSTGATSGSAVTPAVTNNGDGTATAAAQSLSTLARGICRASITNGVNSHWVLVLNSSDEWEPGESNATGDIYWEGLPTTPDLDVASDDGTSSADNVTEDTTPTFKIQFSASEFIGLKDDVAGNLYLVNRATGAVTIVAGSAMDFSSMLTISKTTGTLSIGDYDVYSVLYMTFVNSGYTYDEWWSSPSRPLLTKIVADSSVVEAVVAKCRLGWLTTSGGVQYVTVDSCSRDVTEDEDAKLNPEEE